MAGPSTTTGTRDRVVTALVTALVATLLALGAAPAAAASPVAHDSSETTVSGRAVTIFMWAEDPDGSALTFTVLTQPAHGTLTGCSDAACTYTPAVGYVGPDSFTFRAADSSATSNTATVSITVLDPGAPTVTPSAEEVTRGRTVVVNVTAHDPQQDALAFTVSRTVTDGRLGTFGPVSCDDAGWCAADIAYTASSATATFDDFDVTARDPAGHLSLPATITLDYLEEEGPLAVSEAVDVLADSSTPLELTASDDNGDPLTFTLLEGPDHGTITPLSSPDCDGYFCTTSTTYTTAGYHGLDQLTFRVSDGTRTSGTATVNLAVTDGPCSGVVVSNSTVRLGVNCKGQLITGGTGLARVSSGLDGLRAGCACEGWGVADTTTGLSGWANQGKGTSPNTALLSFTSTASTATSVVDVGQRLRVTHDYHPAAASSSAYEAVVTVRNTSTATQQVRYRRVLDFDVEPTSFNEYVTMKAPSGTPVVFTSNDGLASGDPLAGPSDRGATGSFTDHGPKDQGALVDLALGSLAPGEARSFTLYLGASTSAANALSALSAVGAATYALAKPSGTSGLSLGSPTTFFLGYGRTSAPVNTAPVAADDALAVTQPASGTVAVLANDTDADNDSLTASVTTQPAHGSATCTATGSCTYTPASGWSGPDSFTYTVADGQGGSDVGTVSVSVAAAANRAPDAVADAATTTEDTSRAVVVTGNDTDPDGDPLTVVSHTHGTKGTVTCTTSTCTYVPGVDTSGTDAFTYTVADGRGGTDTATVTMTVTPVNDAPRAIADVASTAEDTARSVAVLANDTDAEGDALSVTASTQGAGGTVTCTASACTYTPRANWHGTDSFTYTVSDGRGAATTGTVTMTVAPVNDPPVADDDALAVGQDEAGALDVLLGDTDPDGDLLVVSAVADGGHGTVTCLVGVCTYQPAAGWVGTDSFTYTLGDGHGGSDEGRVVVSVGNVNDAPLAGDDAVTTPEDTAVGVEVTRNDSDADGDPLTAGAGTTGSSAGAPTHGTATCTGTTCRYVPDPNWHGTDSFTYTVRDPLGATDVGTVVVTVAPVNDAPVALGDTATTPSGTAVTVPVTANDTDVDGDVLSASVATAPTSGTATCTAGRCTFTPARKYAGTATFGYRAADGRGGTALATVAVTVQPATKPGRTTTLTAASGDAGGPATAVVRWDAPTSDGGSDLLSYEVLVLEVGSSGRIERRGVVRADADAERRRVRLPAGRYRFRVAAVNAVGRARWSERSDAARSR